MSKYSASSFTIIVSFLCIALVGAIMLPMLTVRLHPLRYNPSITVNFSLPGSSARVVEMEATSKLDMGLFRQTRQYRCAAIGSIIYCSSGLARFTGWHKLPTGYGEHTQRGKVKSVPDIYHKCARDTGKHTKVCRGVYPTGFVACQGCLQGKCKRRIANGVAFDI